MTSTLIATGGLGDNDVVMFYRGDGVGKTGWGWKLATTIDDAYDFLNGTAPYSKPVQDAEILGTANAHFYIFYRH